MQENQQLCFLLSPVYISFQPSVEIKNVHTRYSIQNPHLPDCNQVILTFCLSLMTVILTGKQSEFKYFQLPSYQEILCFISQVSVTEKDNPFNQIWEAQLLWMLFGSLVPARCTGELQSPTSQAFSQLSIFKEPKEDLKFLLLVKSRRLQMPF